MTLTRTVNLASAAILSGLNKSVEFEADRMGVVLAARAGYDAFGLLHTLMTLDGAGRDSEFLSHFLSTHPAISKRFEALNTVLGNMIEGDPGRASVNELARLQTGLK